LSRVRSPCRHEQKRAQDEPLHGARPFQAAERYGELFQYLT